MINSKLYALLSQRPLDPAKLTQIRGSLQRRIMGAEGGKMDVDVGVRCFAGVTGRHRRMHLPGVKADTCHNIGSRTAFYKRIAAIVFSRYMYTSCRVASLKTNN